MKKMILSFMLVFGFLTTAQAAETTSSPTPKQMAETVYTQFNAIKTPQDRSDLSKYIVEHYLDLRSMSTMTLGSSFRSLSDTQKATYMKSFGKYLEGTINNILTQYPNFKLDNIKETVDGDMGSLKTHILMANKQPIKFDLTLRNVNGNWKVIDFVIEDISLMGGYRAQFISKLNKDGFDNLITYLNR